MGKVIKFDHGRLYQGDALDVLADLVREGIQVDLILTSPPYNIGIGYDAWNDSLPWEEYLNFSREWLTLCWHLLKPQGGRICVNVLFDLGRNRDPLIGRRSPMMEFFQLFREVGIKYHGVATWIDSTRPKRTAWGSWLSPSAPYIYNPYEAVLIGFRDQWRKPEGSSYKVEKDLFMEMTSGIWEVGTTMVKGFPVPFPEKLARMCIEGLTYPGDLVLDPFIGSGTVGLVAEKTGRKWIGIEISERYCALAEERIRTGKWSVESRAVGKCLLCGDEIFSSGEQVSCRCGNLVLRGTSGGVKVWASDPKRVLVWDSKRGAYLEVNSPKVKGFLTLVDSLEDLK